jgi:hypothetical protein
MWKAQIGRPAVRGPGRRWRQLTGNGHAVLQLAVRQVALAVSYRILQLAAVVVIFCARVVAPASDLPPATLDL